MFFILTHLYHFIHNFTNYILCYMLYVISYTNITLRYTHQKLLLFLFRHMQIIIAFLIFCLVLFIYLHVQFHLKTSNDLEIYEVEQASKEKIEDVCDIRQPVLFDFDCQKIMESTSKEYIRHNYPAFEVKIKKELTDTENIQNSGSDLYLPLQLKEVIKLLDDSTGVKYFSENNCDFLQETGVLKSMQYNDQYLRPYMVSNCNYDIMMGSNNCTTPLQFKLNYRNYFLLTQGSATIKLTPPQNTKYLYPNYDYENFVFSSPVNVWSPQAKYKADYEKIKCLEFVLKPGKTLFIPAYWWYSIKFDNNASISCFYYKTYMNNVAILPYITLHGLQLQNIKRDVTKKIDIIKLNEDTKQPQHEKIDEQSNEQNNENHNHNKDINLNNMEKNENNTNVMNNTTETFIVSEHNTIVNDPYDNFGTELSSIM